MNEINLDTIPDISAAEAMKLKTDLDKADNLAGLSSSFILYSYWFIFLHLENFDLLALFYFANFIFLSVHNPSKYISYWFLFMNISNQTIIMPTPLV